MKVIDWIAGALLYRGVRIGRHEYFLDRREEDRLPPCFKVRGWGRDDSLAVGLGPLVFVRAPLP